MSSVPSDVLNMITVEHDYVYRADRSFSAIGLKKGGGVAVAVRNDFKSSLIDLGLCPSFININPKIDIVVIRIKIHHSNIYVISLYIPPQISVSDYEAFVEAIQSLDFLHGSSVFIVGDFNGTSYAAYLDSNNSNGFINSLNVLAGFFNANQYNYVHNENGNLLDLVVSNVTCFVEHATDPLVYEDIHHPALIVTVMNLPAIKKNDVLHSDFLGNYNFRKANFQLLYEMILNVSWESLVSMTNVDSACELFYSEIYTILDYCVPKVKKIHTHMYPPWYNRHLIKTLKQKTAAFKKYKESGNIAYQVEFKKLRSELKNQVSVAYRHYIESVESDIANDSSKFWGFGQSMTDPKNISEAFAEYFSKATTIDIAPDRVRYRKKLMVQKWKDKKEVLMVSSIHDERMETAKRRTGDIQKPVCVLEYNSKMGGVVLNDNYLHFYGAARSRVKKSYIKIFWHFLSITTLNSYHIYKETGGKPKETQLSDRTRREVDRKIWSTQ
nr:unnamed protein product [Callosobruchus chinensis]